MIRFDTVVTRLISIKEFQVVQNSLDLSKTYVVPTQSFFESDIQLVENNVKLHVGDIQTNIELVQNIERSSSGKFRAEISKVPCKQ
jgi:hypothetical protein